MNTHQNARLTVHGRALLVRRVLEHGLRVTEAVQAAGVSVRTAYTWLKRYREAGPAGLHNRSSRPRRFRRLCRRLALEHRRTRPYSPRTNGKAERFIQTALREWAYRSSEQRAHHLPRWLHHYNWHRPHASLNGQPPISRLESVNNLVGLHN